MDLNIFNVVVVDGVYVVPLRESTPNNDFCNVVLAIGGLDEHARLSNDESRVCVLSDYVYECTFTAMDHQGFRQ